MKNKTPTRPMLEYKYASAGKNLYLVAAFTAINLVLLLTNMNRYFLFSASIPYVFTSLTMYLCGMMPAEYYEGMGPLEFLPANLFYVALAISILSVALYVLCGILSRKHRIGWLIAALVLFSLDTAFMVLSYGIDVSMIMDIVFHVWVLVILIQGVSAHYKLKKMPPEEIVAEAEAVDEVADQAESVAEAIETEATHDEDEAVNN